ncbi:pentapeptide repeat-containing protein [Pseudactinotalea suaedae]|uniref:pentapeptide repeat-containing protein n=1 Tax=Pseudactinotalea suaedae TaxID=1524924 RepID=UPI0012E30ADF|nr:pentapeptide repeat-containing protein [Pseudactinotalea suaedae]
MTALPPAGTTTSAAAFDGAVWIAAELDEVAVESSTLTRLRASGGTWTRTSFIDCALDGADLAGVMTTDSALVRCTLDGARLTGSQWLRSRWRQLDVTEAVAEELSAHGSTWTDVTFTKTRLRDLDLSEARLVRVRFVDCDLTGARFAGVRCSDVSFSGCTMEGITGVAGLRGARLGRSDAASALPALASELGIRVTDE